MNATKAQEVQFFAEDAPQLLSEWGLFEISDEALSLNQGVVPYDLNTPLFTDYAHKLRTIWVPAGQAASYRDGDYPDFPVGAIISKTFYYPTDGEAVRKTPDTSGALTPLLSDKKKLNLIETRLLVRRDSGWVPLSYVWNSDQTDAKLTKIGAVKPLTLVGEDGAREDFTYIVPNINQCAGCHAPNNTTREIAPLGVRPRHLNKAFDHGAGAVSQIDHLQLLGYLEGVPPADARPQNAVWTDTNAPLNARARAYLDINCAHCHNAVGPADTSGLDLSIDVTSERALGLCKLPIAAGSGTGGKPFDIVPGEPDQSILLHRMQTNDPGAMMPELGRAIAHEEGIALITEWIAAMDGSCSAQ